MQSLTFFSLMISTLFAAASVQAQNEVVAPFSVATEIDESDSYQESATNLSPDEALLAVAQAQQPRPKICEEWRIGEDKPILEPLQNDFEKIVLPNFFSLDNANDPEKKSDGIVSKADFAKYAVQIETEMKKLLSFADSDSAAIQHYKNVFERFATDDYFLLLDNASNGSKPDGKATLADFVVLMQRMRVIQKICQEPSNLPEPTKHCFLCSYDDEEEKKCNDHDWTGCQASTLCTWKGDRCTSRWKEICETSKNRRNGPKDVALVVPESSFYSRKSSLEGTFEQCRWLSDLHVAHSSHDYMTMGFPSRLATVYASAPRLERYFLKSYGCDVFSSASGLPSVDEALFQVHWLMKSFGLEKTMISVEANQDKGFMVWWKDGWAAESPATVVVDTSVEPTRTAINLKKCWTMVGERCINKGSQMMCEGVNNEREYLTCRPGIPLVEQPNRWSH